MKHNSRLIKFSAEDAWNGIKTQHTAALEKLVDIYTMDSEYGRGTEVYFTIEEAHQDLMVYYTDNEVAINVFMQDLIKAIRDKDKEIIDVDRFKRE